MNLLMQAPLLDSRGNLRYFIGAQIDVSGLVKDATDLPALQRMLEDQNDNVQSEVKDEFQELSEMLNHAELDTVRKFGGNMHRDHLEDQDDKSMNVQRPRLLIRDQSTFDVDTAEKPLAKPEGRLSGPYKHVSDLCLLPLEMSHSDNYTVPSCPPRTIPPHSLHFALSSCPRHPSVTLPRPHRWLKPRA